MGDLTVLWGFLIKGTYSGQDTTSYNNQETGKLTCKLGDSTFYIVAAPPDPIVSAFSANSSRQIVVTGAPAIAGTYIPGKAIAQGLDLNFPFELDPSMRFKYVIKRRGEPTRAVVGPLSRLYQELSMWRRVNENSPATPRSPHAQLLLDCTQLRVDEADLTSLSRRDWLERKRGC
jgi:hypothetical protein